MVIAIMQTTSDRLRTVFRLMTDFRQTLDRLQMSDSYFRLWTSSRLRTSDFGFWTSDFEFHTFKFKGPINYIKYWWMFYIGGFYSLFSSAFIVNLLSPTFFMFPKLPKFKATNIIRFTVMLKIILIYIFIIQSYNW